MSMSLLQKAEVAKILTLVLNVSMLGPIGGSDEVSRLICRARIEHT